MVDIPRSNSIVARVRQCRNGEALFELIRSDPERYNVHHCLTLCNPVYVICRNLIFNLVLAGLLDENEVSHHYDNLVDPDIRPEGERTVQDFLQYLGGTVDPVDGFRQIYNRYCGAWNALVDARIQLQRLAREPALPEEAIA